MLHKSSNLFCNDPVVGPAGSFLPALQLFSHARKMVARMEALGNSVFYYENTNGGHGAAANLQEKAYRNSLEFIYLSRELQLD